MAASRIPDPDERPTITVPEAGALLDLKPRTSYDAAKRGDFPVIRVGNRLKVPTARFLREVLGLTD
jgi:hypothetical protein